MAQLLAAFLSFQGQDVTRSTLNDKLVSFQKPYDEEQHNTFNKILEEKQRNFEIKDKVPEKPDVPAPVEKKAAYTQTAKPPVEDTPDDKKKDSLHKNVKVLVTKSSELNNSVNELKDKMKKLLEKAKPQKSDNGQKPNINILKTLFAEVKQNSIIASKHTMVKNEKNRSNGKEQSVSGMKNLSGKNIRTVVIDLRDKVMPKKEMAAADKNISFKAAFTAKQKTSPKTQDTKIYTDSFKQGNAREQNEVKLFVKNPGMVDALQARNSEIRESSPVREAVPMPRLNETIRNEMVKQTGIVIKNGGAGEINLVLKPESLGNVRIKLSIEDNNIVGKIFVDNNTVKQIVESNMDHLQNSFSEKGYHNAMIDVFVQGEGSEQAETGEEPYGTASSPEYETEEMEPDVFLYEQAAPESSYVNIVL
ncbi:MAG: flagellar hook-length control protein FliK [Spirochaetales bacterium]|nr:flagellar hook-length control protein FliK [Spirochaetales bacterium]